MTRIKKLNPKDTGLDKKELAILKKLSTPIKIQDFLDAMPLNFETKGETYMSPRRVLKENRCHCFEGALLAALALWLHGEKPLLLDLQTTEGDDHIVALYQRNGYWGGISKTNHSDLRFRDPVYKTIRELALSYFHEYFNLKSGIKILENYSVPFDLRRLGTKWIIEEEDMHDLAVALDDTAHHSLLPKENRRYVRKADSMEMRAGNLIDWNRNNTRNM